MVVMNVPSFSWVQLKSNQALFQTLDSQISTPSSQLSSRLMGQTTKQASKHAFPTNGFTQPPHAHQPKSPRSCLISKKPFFHPATTTDPTPYQQPQIKTHSHKNSNLIFQKQTIKKEGRGGRITLETRSSARAKWVLQNLHS